MDDEEPTQATQNVLDPRRVGKQNSGFSDEDISDIICVLYPHSDSARAEVERLAREDCPHIIGKDQADVVEPDYQHEDHASRFESNLAVYSDYAIILRLSALVKNPAAGFAFGRNSSRCDIVFENDPLKRVSNIHFRIYVNEWGNVMIEDQSTNGTFVDSMLLTTHPKDRTKAPVTKWVLNSGNLVMLYLHKEIRDLTFRVRIPRRDNEYDRAYTQKVGEYFARHGLQKDIGATPTIRPGPSGHVDLFGTAAQAPARPTTVANPTAVLDRPGPGQRKEISSVKHMEWDGSGKYNRTGTIGKGAFAVVYKVTSKYDGKPYAAKELEKRRFIKNGVLDQKVENEMKIMQKVQHPNIVRYIESIDWDDRLLIIIMEFVPGGDLGKYIGDYGSFPEDWGQLMSVQLLSALGYLHAKNITHRDVKPDNILMQSMDPLEVKLTDFGLSKMIDSEQTFLRTFCGTLLYCAPEVYTEYVEYDEHGIRNRGKRVRRAPGQRYSHAVDIWSLGGVIFYALTGSPPYPVKSGISHSELLHKVMTTRLNVVPLQKGGVTDVGIDFIQRMLQRRPEIRATVGELTNHPWLGGAEPTIEASQSYDEITDDEDVAPGQAPADEDIYGDEDFISDSMGEDDMDGEADKENATGYQTMRPRLFGEVGNSAIGSSGAIPSHYLNLPYGNGSQGATEILDPQMDANSDSEGASSRNGKYDQHRNISLAQAQSADQLQSLVEDVASQSLGGSDAAPHGVNASHVTRHSVDFNSSKRKPVSFETSDEFDNHSTQGKPTIKRFKSTGQIDDLTDAIMDEYKLLASIPPIQRLGSGRQIDKPVKKAAFWDPDPKTWHLNYPEMTQLQLDAFLQAARNRNEEFRPGKTPLWDIAMKHFPPTPGLLDQLDASRVPSAVGLRRDDRKISEDTEFPPTAVQEEDIPDTLVPEAPIVVPVSTKKSERAIGVIESAVGSCIRGISFPLADSLTSFGRGPDNTEIFELRSEPRMPKNAFKVMLWKEDFDPAKDPAKVSLPWLRAPNEPSDAYFFWISTKATLGIRINGYHLPSSDAKNPTGPSRHWTKIFNGDELTVWGGPDLGAETKLVFRCFWGGSSRSRGDVKHIELAMPAVAQKLDAACQKTERRIRDAAEKQRREEEVHAEDMVRTSMVARERDRSRVFEARRQEAVAHLKSRQMTPSRRNSPASAPLVFQGNLI
ncbi:hypothetical protein S40285_08160 [Stachybotrys chlorohalonatus IBT 40285]|uniref:Autophagy-related protein 1 n=1 Tax=Stachybotrys chlorohalonatus (strain IBT 40285) TaxID=1283841 RepID=A0A084QE26_STAC4|nr:hypothetical protein S40285_08160 [Stachybotrys chlorohalonata IBT 40285]